MSPHTALTAGTQAPDFTLHSTPDQAVSLSRAARPSGHPGLLSGRLEPGVRRPDGALQRDPRRVPALRRGAARHLGRRRRGATVAFAHDRKLHFPLLADFEPKGERRAALRRLPRSTRARASARCSCIDGEGVIRWSYVSPVGVNPGADGILDALESLAGTLRHATRREARHADAGLVTSTTTRRARPTRRSRWSSTATTSARTAGAPTRSSRRCSARLGERLRFVFRNFPLTKSTRTRSTRRRRRRAAARVQGRFWAMHDADLRAPAGTHRSRFAQLCARVVARRATIRQ